MGRFFDFSKLSSRRCGSGIGPNLADPDIAATAVAPVSNFNNL